MCHKILEEIQTIFLLEPEDSCNYRMAKTAAEELQSLKGEICVNSGIRFQ